MARWLFIIHSWSDKILRVSSGKEGAAGEKDPGGAVIRVMDGGAANDVHGDGDGQRCNE